jgi:DNA-binding response OmpR family regulator
MSLQSLVFCSDEKILRVLRRVLSDLEIHVEHCSSTDATIQKLTRQRFEAVIVDCADEDAASQILRSSRAAPCNKRAIAVAIVDGATALRSAFDLGAHFVLYKPISTERAKASFRAARALMKRERRRNTRVAVEIPVTLIFDKGTSQQHTATTDISEGGMALKLSRRPKGSGAIHVEFTLPGTEKAIHCKSEVAWESVGRQAGVRFVDMPAETRSGLKAWLRQQSSDLDKDDPPVSCKLTDLSLGGCYLDMASPFPVRTLVVLSMRVGQLQVKAEGVVRVMHPEQGMGIEFTQKTQQQRDHVEKLIQGLMKSEGALPDLLVEPEGLESDDCEVANATAHDEVDDPLVDLFQTKAYLSAEAFQMELRKQRGPTPQPSESVITN